MTAWRKRSGNNIIIKHKQIKTVIVVAGPTAVGKTSYAIQLAQKYNTSIISADSRQCFKELHIGVAKPSPTQLREVPHYFISSHSIHDEVNARVFEEYALEKLTEIFRKKDVAIMVGGTGLYIKAFTDSLDAVPEVSEEIRQEIREKYRTNGKEWLQQQIRQHDPDFALHGEMENPQRMMRALEIALSTGRSLLEFHSNGKVSRPFEIVKLGLQLPREELYNNINERVDRMMDDGLLAEARGLLPFRHLNPLKTVGYMELFDFLDGKCSLDQAVEKIKINTRRYAKRQMTWFRKDGEIKWIDGKQAANPV